MLCRCRTVTTAAAVRGGLLAWRRLQLQPEGFDLRRARLLLLQRCHKQRRQSLVEWQRKCKESQMCLSLSWPHLRLLRDWRRPRHWGGVRHLGQRWLGLIGDTLPAFADECRGERASAALLHGQHGR